MANATPQQRIEWLQNGLREIGRLCLQLSGDGQVTEVKLPKDTESHLVPVDEATESDGAAPVGESIDEFLERVEDVTPQERMTIVEAAITRLSQVFVPRPLKRAMHGIDPTQRLRLLHERLKAQIRNGDAPQDDRSFHDEMIEIFHSLRDLHTNYVLPRPYHGQTAFLPFTIEEYFEGQPPNRKRHYIITRTLGRVPASFKPGVTVTHWNGIPIGRAVQLNAAREAGSNADARHARGLEALTLRPMALTAPPDETWVIIDYLADGQPQQAKFEWRVVSPYASVLSATADGPMVNGAEAARVLGYAAETESTRRARKFLFHPAAMKKENRMARAMVQAEAAPQRSPTPASQPALAAELKALGAHVPAQALEHLKDALKHFTDVGDAQQSLAGAAQMAAAADLPDVDPRTNSLMPDFFGFRKVNTSEGEFGYIRIYSFLVNDANAFVAEFVRIAQLLPQRGLIIDLRGNGGGNIWAGEQLLQVMSPIPIEPERFHFVNTPTTLQLCQKHENLKPWVESIELAVQTGEIYSQGIHITSREAANSIGQKYRGKVVLIVDALCYSTTDIFAAGFQDHKIGKILGTNGRTGAGGANVWDYQYFSGLESFSRPLPQGVGFRTALRRSTRVGDRAGVPLEDLGVQPDDVHYMTRRDILENNIDVINAAAELLVGKRPKR